MTDPLVTLLHDIWEYGGPTKDGAWGPPSIEEIAARLLAAGVTLTQPQPDAGRQPVTLAISDLFKSVNLAQIVHESRGRITIDEHCVPKCVDIADRIAAGVMAAAVRNQYALRSTPETARCPDCSHVWSDHGPRGCL